MRVLKNIDHTFDVVDGDVGCTIRKGTKWTEMSVGEMFELSNCSKAHIGDCSSDCSNEGLGICIGYWYGELKNLPPALLSIEHNKSARNIYTLKKMLRAGYGEINGSDVFTALIYKRVCGKVS